MAVHEFVMVGTGLFHRVNKLGVLESVGLQKDMYGRKFFTINLSLLPLCAPVKSSAAQCQKRLTALFNNNHWYDYLTAQEAQTSFEQLKEHLENYAFSWFLQMQNFDVLLPYLGIVGACYLAKKHKRNDLLLANLKQFQKQLDAKNMTLNKASQSDFRDLKEMAIALRLLLNEGMGNNSEQFIRSIEKDTSKITKTPIERFKF